LGKCGFCSMNLTKIDLKNLSNFLYQKIEKNPNR
jgi:hypothetical protein